MVTRESRFHVVLLCWLTPRVTMSPHRPLWYEQKQKVKKKRKNKKKKVLENLFSRRHFVEWCLLETNHKIDVKVNLQLW